jgi:hypothetical protein
MPVLQQSLQKQERSRKESKLNPPPTPFMVVRSEHSTLRLRSLHQNPIELPAMLVVTAERSFLMIRNPQIWRMRSIEKILPSRSLPTASQAQSRRTRWEMDQHAGECTLPWRAAEAKHWQMGELEMARRAGVTAFTLSNFEPMLFTTNSSRMRSGLPQLPSLAQPTANLPVYATQSREGTAPLSKTF